MGGFDDIASFRAETKAPPAEISDAEIVLLIESDNAHIAAHQAKKQAAALYVENAKLRHLASVKPTESVRARFDRLEYSPSVWLNRVTSPAHGPAHPPAGSAIKSYKPSGKPAAKPAAKKPAARRKKLPTR